jgi:DNA polymerase III subunit chi
MAEVWFYHLESRSADQELPGLLLRGLERGVRMAVITASARHEKELSNLLWGHEETAFIPHGLQGEPFPQQQAIFLASDDNPPNAATYRFYVGGTEPSAPEELERASILFDGHDESAIERARTHWKACKAKGLIVKYWKQDEQGRWKDQAAG